MDQPLNEAARLQTLREYQILDTPPDAAIDRITRLASLVCETPISLVTLLDQNRQWFKSNVGMPESETSRRLAFCNYVVADGAPLEVPNATLDERFQQNPLVTADPAIRFYAGYPLTDPEGYVLGSLCVMDLQPRRLSPRQHEALELLSHTVIDLIVERRAQQRQRQFDQLFVEADDLIAIAGRDGYFKTVNPAFERVLGWTADELLQTDLYTWVHPQDRARTRQLVEAVTTGPLELTHRFRSQEGTYRHLHWVMNPEPGFNNFFAIIRDMTPQQQQEEALRQTQQQLQQANQELERQVDNSSLKRAESALQLAFQRHRLATKAGKLGVWELNLRTGAIQLEADFYTLLDLHPIASITCLRDLEGLLSPRDQAHFRPRLQALLSEGAGIDTEFRVVSPRDGAVYYLQVDGQVLPDAQGKPERVIGVMRDRTQARQTQRALQASEARYRSLVDALQVVVFQTDAQDNWCFLNPAWETVTGFPVASSRGQLFLDSLLPDQRDHSLSCFNDLKAGQIPSIRYLTRFRHQGGGYRWIEVFAQPTRDARQQMTGVTGTLTDVTDNKETKDRANQLHERLQLATQAAGQGIWEVDLTTNRVNWDEALFALHGLPIQGDDWTFDHFLATIHPDDRSAFSDKSQAEGMGTDQVVSNTYQIQRSDGAVCWIQTRGRVMRSLDGQALRMLGVAWDVTERKLAEEALWESEQRFRDFADNVDEVFWIHSAQPFRLLYINPAYERIWHRPVQRVYDDPTAFMEGIMVEDRPAMRTFFADYVAGKDGQLDYRLRNPDGSIRWLTVRTFIVRDGAGQVTRHLGIVNDITAQKEKELVLLESLQREQELNQLKSQFVSTASHEFRTPLTTIRSSMDLIQLYLDQPPATARVSIEHHIGVIHREIEKFSALLSDLLTIGKIDAGKIAFTPKWIDLMALIEELIELHFKGHLFDERRVGLTIEGTPRPVYLDTKLMSHVLLNLLSNAFKFSSGASPRLCISFELKRVVLTITDTGIGIPAGDVASLFQPFFRASNTAGIQGTGLGLVIARQFVELHRGELGVASAENEGTTFTIHLPAETEGQDPEM